MLALQDLTNGLLQATTKEQAVALFRRFLEAIDIPNYAYLGFQGLPGRDAVPFRAGLYPAAWIEEYMADKLYAVDPPVLQAAQSTLPVNWSADPEANGGIRDPILSRGLPHGIRSGCTIPIRSSIGQLATLTVASGVSHLEFGRLMSERMGPLHLASFHFHAAIERIIGPVNDVHLTPQERFCLQMKSQGKSFKEVALMLGISARGVRFHCDNLRAKLRAKDIPQAISTARSLNLI